MGSIEAEQSWSERRHGYFNVFPPQQARHLIGKVDEMRRSCELGGINMSSRMVLLYFMWLVVVVVVS